MLGRGSTIPTGIFRDLPTETTDGTRHDSIPIAGAIEKKVKRSGEGTAGTSRGNPNVCYALSIRIPDSEIYMYFEVCVIYIYIYIGNMDVTKRL